MLLAGTLLFIAVLSALSNFQDLLRGWGDDTPDRARNPEGHASSIRFGWWLSGLLLAGALISAILGY